MYILYFLTSKFYQVSVNRKSNWTFMLNSHIILKEIRNLQKYEWNNRIVKYSVICKHTVLFLHNFNSVMIDDHLKIRNIYQYVSISRNSSTSSGLQCYILLVFLQWKLTLLNELGWMGCVFIIVKTTQFLLTGLFNFEPYIIRICCCCCCCCCCD
jgi:hypothetical protein